MFDKNGLATKTFKTLVYSYNAEKEFNGSLYIQIEEGTGIPAQTTLIKPNERKDGLTQIFNEADQKWQHIEDHRGKTAYNTETRQPIEIDFIGDLPETLTLLEPKAEFDKWNGKKWVTDTEAQKEALIAEADNKKALRLSEANGTITYLQDAVDVGLATEDETAALLEWKKYRVLLNRVDTSTAPDIVWPVKPVA